MYSSYFKITVEHKSKLFSLSVKTMSREKKTDSDSFWPNGKLS